MTEQTTRQRIGAALEALSNFNNSDFDEVCTPSNIRQLLAEHDAELAAKDAEIARLWEAAGDFLEIIDKAGLIQLSNGVQLGATSWYVKASDSLNRLRAALPPKGQP